ncbi:hypothetical protein [Vibrio azureus]|uniref:Uncharacterized protein n=1 Tax=Vibrio azureus NBRC 104587 TaxID=1219077 RepID=U3AMQ1_9VIBR|nr:hypothetical protein [Vibrio azureus]GAD74577.1 hypothetical protein VAZ01S_012_00580 [Vibrio azureus NBRC 104587]
MIEYAWPTFEESNSIYMGRMKDEDILYVNLHNISFIDVISVYKEIENGHSLLLDMSDIELNEKRVIMSQQLIKFGLDAPLIAFNKKNTDSSFYNISVSMEDKKNVIRKSIAYVVSKISKAGEENE